MEPADLFRIERVGSTTWSPTGHFATIEIHRPDRWLDRGLPAHELLFLDARTGALQTLCAPDKEHVGCFGATWSPNGERLSFLSVDTGAVVRPWLWDVGSRRPRLLPGLRLRSGSPEPVTTVWTDDDHVVFLALDSAAENRGSLYFRLLRGRNAADNWQRVHAGETATVSVVESGGPNTIPSAAMSRIVSVDVRTGARRTLARGPIHLLRLSPDRRILTFFQEGPGVPAARVASFLAPAAQTDDLYGRVNWGTVLRAIDPNSGVALAPPADLVTPEYDSFRWLRSGGFAIRTGGTDDSTGRKWIGLRDGQIRPIVLRATDTARVRTGPARPRPEAPRPDARLTSVSPSGAAAFYVANDPSDGTRLWLARRDRPPLEVWRGNAWVRQVRTGKTEAIPYTGTDGKALSGWLLLPPDHDVGTRIPVVTIVYPGRIYASREPSAFSLFSDDYDHPQLFAALGYGVLLPSMPEPDQAFQEDAIASLSVGVLPLLDTLVARGIADPARIAVVGQSSGGFASLGLITVTDRFRTAIASASYSDLLSLYGTFYGQHRYGDAGHPQVGQLLRMLQFERGVYGMVGPPWEQPAPYLLNSPLLRAANVRTPVMLVHGDLDFVPVQQAEEFFTAMYRQDKRARFVRYHGEWHTISARANVLDLWNRMSGWLDETMGPRGS